MPFGFFKKAFKKAAGDAAEQYGGKGARDFVEENIEKVNVDQHEAALMQSFTGGQQAGLQSLFGAIGGSLGGLENMAASKGLDPQLVSSLMALLSGGGGGSGGGTAAASGGQGFNMGSLLNIVQSLTKGGSSGGGGVDGFLSLISGGGGSGGSGNSNNILNILIGLAKSFFGIKMGSNRSMQDWGDAGAKSNKDDGNFGNWGGHIINDLINPGKKDKDRINDDPTDKPTGGKDAIKGWFDGHPEIGKMQKDIFDDVFDTTDKDDEDRLDDDPTPLIPAPKGFETDCSALDQASILFLNTNVLLDLRKEWRFLYSFKSHSKDYAEFLNRIQLKGPTIVLIQDTDGNMFGAFTSTSWVDSEGGWIGNGDSFIFAIKPKMAIFHATGKDDNIMYMSQADGIGLGGRIGRFGLSISPDLETGNYHEEVETFDLPPKYPEQFQIAHLEVWGLGPETDPERERSKLHVRKPNVNVRRGNVDLDDLADQIG